MINHLTDKTAEIVQKIPYLKMLILFGSRVRGDTHYNSDWDFAVLYDQPLRKKTVEGFGWFEIYGILADTFQIPDDKIDVVDLDHCSPLLLFHVAKDGKVLYEKNKRDFIKFQMKAWKLYADSAKFRKLQQESIKLWLQKWGV
jgi:predicted nucleotidyltransferase